MSDKNIKIYKLDNDIPVLFDKIEGIQTVSLGIFLKVGAKHETLEEEGMSHLIEHMMFKGTSNRTAKDISEDIDNEGGMVNAYTSKENTVYYIQMLSNRIKKGIEVFNDMFLNSTFTEENIEKEKSVIIEEINMYDDMPEDLVQDQNNYFIIDGVQKNRILGTKESLNYITRDMLIKYFKEQYTAENIVVSVAGNFSEKEILETLNKGIGKIEKAKSIRKYDGKMSLKNEDNIIKKDSKQVHLCFNTLGTSLFDKERYCVSIISTVLAGNMSSRLFQKIREERGLAYSVYGYSSSYEEGGYLTIYAGTTLEDYKEVIDIIENEFEDIKNNGITEYELQKIKNQFLSGLTFVLETTKGRMNRIANSYLLHGEVKELDAILAKIENITVEDIKRVSQKIFDKKYYSKTILGNI